MDDCGKYGKIKSVWIIPKENYDKSEPDVDIREIEGSVEIDMEDVRRTPAECEYPYTVTIKMP